MIIMPKTQYPIADLHCDLLCYLSLGHLRSPYDLPARCSIPQLREGNVKFQMMAIFAETTPGSSKNGMAQAETFKKILSSHSEVFELIRESSQFNTLQTSNKIGILPAIENASSFCEEEEPLKDGLHRFTTMQRKTGKCAYVSLTWNTENRFGGGALTSVGLKDDGKHLIDYLSEHGIALDFSHASDRLAFDILNYLDQNNLQLPLIASHSNFRTITNVPRNLPTDLAKEVLKRRGVIGLNFIRPFVGHESISNFSKQLEFSLQLGYPEGICLGADFFYPDDVSMEHRKSPEQLFFPDFDQAGAYVKVIDLWKKELTLSHEQLKNICYNNLINFLKVNLDLVRFSKTLNNHPTS
ncbi:MAG: membrane dipeptidase [Parachlamydiaceae bacterium]|nr:membrane dipeptidase [Parachlamydiaceae bacterium]